MLASLRERLRGPGRPLKTLLLQLKLIHLRWIYLVEGIDGVANEIRVMRRGWIEALRAFGADVGEGAEVPGPPTIVNARRDFSNLRIGDYAYLGRETFFDLAEPVTIEARAVLTMRVVIITHFDAGPSPIALERPRRSGPVTIGEGAYVGTGAIILHGVTVGAEALIRAGDVVTRDVPPGARPARNHSEMLPESKRL